MKYTKMTLGHFYEKQKVESQNPYQQRPKYLSKILSLDVVWGNSIQLSLVIENIGYIFLLLKIRFKKLDYECWWVLQLSQFTLTT